MRQQQQIFESQRVVFSASLLRRKMNSLFGRHSRMLSVSGTLIYMDLWANSGSAPPDDKRRLY